MDRIMLKAIKILLHCCVLATRIVTILFLVVSIGLILFNREFLNIGLIYYNVAFIAISFVLKYIEEDNANKMVKTLLIMIGVYSFFVIVL